MARGWRDGLGLLALVLCVPALCAPPGWDGPVSGPAAVPGKSIVFIAQDFRNSGITALYREFQGAGQKLGWHLSVVDGTGSAATIRQKFAEALKSKPDGIVLGGFNENDIADLVPEHCRTVLMGWHAGPSPGPTAHLFSNITTDPMAVADMATDYLVRSAGPETGVVIFNDDRFDVANAKTRRMQEDLQHCAHCRLLAIDNLPISEAHERIPAEVRRLNTLFGAQWTHTLAINDIYFDSINAPLAAIGRRDILNIAAGDGSAVAVSRIRSGISQQVATVAEPVGLQGWQMVDEFNRAFAGVPPSGYVSAPILVTTEKLRGIDAWPIDSDIPYRQAYLAIWQGPTSAPARPGN